MQRTVQRLMKQRRRAAVVVQVAVSSALVLGMGALALDLGTLYTAQTELQVSADAAALAGAAELAGTGDVQAAALAAANTYAGLNHVLGLTPTVVTEDVEFGRAIFQEGSSQFAFELADEKWDAVRVTVWREQPPEGLPKPIVLPLSFAQVLGESYRGLQAQAAAVLVPRDIAVVIDLSNSMCWDSTLRSWNRGDGGYANLRDVWCALDGPEPARPYVPGSAPSAVDATEYQADSGPTFGEMTQWGSALVPGSYSASSDPGLWYIPKSSACTVAAARTRLLARGYSSAEADALLSGAQDDSYGNQWQNRVGVILGVAEWHSGKAGGFDPAGGNGNDTVGDGEVTWDPRPSFAQDWNWKSYIGWQRSGFTKRFGLKTLVDYLLENQPEYYSTAGLWATPEQPLRAQKDAVQAMIEEIDSLDSLDHVSLQIFAQNSHLEVDLTDDLYLVPNRLYQMQSGHYDRTTNLGGGLNEAIQTFERPGSLARPCAHKVIMLMSDGQTNVDAYGNQVGDGAPAAVNWALDRANYAASQGYRIYTVSVGYYVDRPTMAQIAQIGRGQEFYASGDPSTYTEELREIFRALGGKRPVALIE